MTSSYSTKGMPDLDMSGNQTSFFEFWPMWAMYLPVVIQWLVLAAYYRSLTVPLIANPQLPLSGMVGVAKSELMSQATNLCDEAILDWFVHTTSSDSIDEQVSSVEKEMEAMGFSYPMVCKPDIGCRGTGVNLIEDKAELIEYLSNYPKNAPMLVQKLASFEPEAGVFYIRHPEKEQGEVVSLALKYSPYIVGDGVQTVAELIEKDPRAGQLTHLYFERFESRLKEVLTKGEQLKLVFSASHCRGAIFRDGRQYITPELTKAIDTMMKDLPEFYYGRLDVKFENIEKLMQGESIEIVEINSASSESLHIWDRKTGVLEAYKSLLFQYRTLFVFGNANRKKGYKTPKLSELIKRWKYEKNLNSQYPTND